MRQPLVQNIGFVQSAKTYYQSKTGSAESALNSKHMLFCDYQRYLRETLTGLIFHPIGKIGLRIIVFFRSIIVIHLSGYFITSSAISWERTIIGFIFAEL